MSTIFDNKININGVEYKRLNMIDSIQLQAKIGSALTGINVQATDEEDAGKQVVMHILQNTDDIISIIKIVTGATDAELNNYEAGSEYDILINLIEHPDVKKIIDNLKKSAGKLLAKARARVQ